MQEEVGSRDPHDLPRHDYDHLPPGKSMMRYLDNTGHSKHIWDPGNESETEAAEALFNSLIAKRYVAFAVKDDGEKGTQIRSFPRTAGKMILSPPVAGG